MTGCAFSAYEKTAPSQTHRAAFAFVQCPKLLVVLGLENLATAIVTIRADVMTQVRFTSGWLHSQRRNAQVIVRAVHTALGWGLLILLDGHDDS